MVMTGRGTDIFAECRSSTVTGGIERQQGGPFTLTNQHGRSMTDTDIFTLPSLVYFGYSFCPDVCPLDLDRNAIAVDILSEHSIDAQPVFISVDPDRDTPAHLAHFAETFHPAMIALTGTPEQLRAAASTYRVVYQKQTPGADGQYLLDHTTMTYLVLPGHGYVEAFARTLDPDTLATRVSCFTATAPASALTGAQN